MRNVIGLGILVALIIAPWGCSKQAEYTDSATGDKVQTTGDKTTVKTENGTTVVEKNGEGVEVRTPEGTMTLGHQSVPPGFPLPIIKDAKVEHSFHTTKASSEETYQVTLSATRPISEIAAFYEKALSDKGLKPERTDVNQDSITMVSLSAQTDVAEAQVLIDREGDQNPRVILNWTNKADSTKARAPATRP